ncbi:MAG TPA: hypothetical protein VMS96_14710 [Terriglobales bacterium]|nr:hypothetical protein [Terriglobales bacterium]
MRIVGARLVLLLLLASWLSPAALASYVTPRPSCCRRGGHHCPQPTEQSFRDARLHCSGCQSLVTAQQAPRVSPAGFGIASHDDHPLVHEFSSACASGEQAAKPSQRAPPSSSH